MTVDELRYTGLAGARTDVVGGNQSIAGRQNECPLRGVEKSRLVFAGRGAGPAGRLIGFSGATGNAKGGNRDEGEALE
jgi:hypothetical protein